MGEQLVALAGGQGQQRLLQVVEHLAKQAEVVVGGLVIGVAQAGNRSRYRRQQDAAYGGADERCFPGHGEGKRVKIRLLEQGVPQQS